MMNKARGRGRPRGETRTRDDILDVARRRFLADGYEKVTLRSVAAEAGVDAALISYHFGSKRGLFGATMALTANPADVLMDALPGELNTLPERILRALLTTWDDPAKSAPMRAMITGAIADADIARLLGEAVQRELLGRLAERIGGPDAATRAAAAATQFVGLIFLRYVLRLEPLASMPADELVRRLAPALRTALAPRRPQRPR